VFWSSGVSARQPASPSVLRVGKHVGEDSATTRANETVGYLVIEAGLGTVDGTAVLAGLGARTIQGMDNAPPYYYAIGGLSAASVAVAGMAGQLGADGGWAVLHGSDAVTGSRLKLAVDEDAKLNEERAHTAEHIGYLVFQDTALRLSGPQAAPRAAAELTLDAAEELVQQALALWDAADGGAIAGSGQEEAPQLLIRDLPGDQLAQAVDGRIVLDLNAAGRGWFVDATPQDDEEFARREDGALVALEGHAAAEQVDLLTVLAHELGHVRGHGHVHDDPQSLMSASLPPGVRRVPQLAPDHCAAVDQLFASDFFASSSRRIRRV